MKTLQLSIIAVTGIILIVGTNLAFAEVQLNNAILAPFKDNELVLVGKVNDVKNMSSQNNTQYSITVEKYLKNSKPFDLLTATGYGARKEITNPYQENYFNQPVFEKGDRVFLYLNQKDGQYVLSPFSFIISEHIPPGTAITVIPNKNNYYGNENVSILGVINKGHLYTSAAEYGKNSTVSIIVSNPNNAKYLTDQINVKPDGSFIYQFKIKGKLGITGGYGAFIDAGGGGSGVTFDYVADPLNQFKLGIAAKDVQCEEKLQLVIKLEGGSPACVKLDTADNLIKRGWAQPTIIPSKKVHEILPLIPNDTVKSSVNPDNQTSSTLKLFISTDSTYTSPGNPIGVDISLNNTSSTPLILTKSDNWPRNDLSSGPCSNLPFGMAILKGYYAEQNMSNANSLVIFQNIPCPLPAKIKSYTFQPLSSKATQECDSLFSCTGLVDMKTHLEISGFVDNNSPHHPFSIGTYTIIAGDQWGHVAIQHFSEAYTTPLANLKGN